MSETPLAGAAGVAVVGMSGRFPGAPDLERFWHNLSEGVEGITFFNQEEAARLADPALLRDPAFVRAEPLLEGTELFDAGFFDMTPREAELTDPQHRLFLECAWEALESAGCPPSRFDGSIGVYAGCGMNYYLLFNLLTNPALVASVPTLQLTVGADKDYLCTRVSYKLNLRGPSLSVQTACSTSLVAVHLACQGLLDYQCDLALAGGVSLKPPGRAGYRYQEGGIVSPDGHCRPFDSRAQGTVFGSGVGVVALKRLEDALEEGDPILAVIRGSAVNNDGSVKVGYTAPGSEGQVAVVSEALKVAEVDPGSISYVEAHGTGTPLGDPIEVSALTQVFRAGTGRRGFCALGSVKGSIGHLDAAAGVAGLIKTVLALRHGRIPPTLHFERPNPQLRLEETPFFVNAEARPWPAGGGPRRAGVSSFGIGGTNAHAVLEEAPPLPLPDAARPWQLLLLSARTVPALEAAASNLARHLRRHPDLVLADAAYTLQAGRTGFEHRRMVVCRTPEEGAAALAAPEEAGAVRDEADTRIVFLFPGQGAQQAGAGRELYEAEPVLRAEIDRCAALLRPDLGFDLRELLFDPGADDRLAQTAVAQPALFTLEYALARLWMKWGVRPAAMIGHSLGEYVAACLAGVFPLEDALSLVAARGRLVQALPPGSMLSVPLPAAELEPLLAGGLALAAENGPGLCAVSGETAAVEALADRLRQRGLDLRPLRTSHAFHSPMMDAAVEPFRELVSRVRLQPPRIPFVSNLTGTWIRPEEATDPRYWAGHLRRPVRFSAGLAALAGSPQTVLLEVGPGQSLSGLARRHPALAGRPVVASLPRKRGDDPEARTLTQAVGRLWLHGASPAWEAFHAPYRRRRIPLPTYPFERRAYWIQPGAAAAPQERRDVADWLFSPVWRRNLRTAPGESLTGDWLIFEDALGVGARLAAELRQRGGSAVQVAPAAGLTRTGDDRYTLDPRRPDHYRELLAELRSAGRAPDRIVHLWSLTGAARPTPAEVQDLGFFSLLHLAQALPARDTGVRLAAVSAGVHDVTGEEEIHPEKATLLGAVLTIPQEYPGFACRAVDLWPPPEGAQAAGEAAARLLAELAQDDGDAVVALRGRYRCTRDWLPVRMERAAGRPLRLRERGTYLITGGLGGIGLVLAEALARTAGARLVLTGRTERPARDGKLLALEALGAEVLSLAADVTDAARMEEAVELAERRFGPIHGVFHAAGAPGGGLIQHKDRQAVEAVFAPKVDGARVLDAVFRHRPLDFMILCSSTFALHGGIGLADYSAANAFLDAFAHHRTQRGAFTLAVNWDGWEEVGMRAAAATVPRRGSAPAAGAHPLLGSAQADGFSSVLAAEGFWPLAEHRVLGSPVLPGTAYLEMVRAALRPMPGERLEVQELAFLSPCAVGEGGQRELRTELRQDGDVTELRVLGRTSPGEAWREHARGRARLAPAAEAPRHRLSDLMAQCGERPADGIRRGGRGTVAWGERWDCVREVWLGDGQALALLELPERFAGDLEDYPLHPALLDAATSFAHLQLGEGGYLPAAWRGATLRAPLPRRLYSHARLAGAGDGEVRYTLLLVDEEGVELATVEELRLRRAGSEASARSAAPAPAAAGRRIRPEEGAEAWLLLLGKDSLPQVAVSPRDLPGLVKGRGRRAEQESAVPPEPAAPAAPRAAHPRPVLTTPFVAPRDPVEETLAALWRELLGIDEVGVEDNFFELGGDSVLGIQLFSRARQLGLQLTTAQLFERQTIADLAAAVRGPETAPAAPAAASGLAPEELEEAFGHFGGGAAVEDVYPLSPLQEGMLFHNLATPRSSLYFDQLSGELVFGPGHDPAAFRRAWQRVVDRHPVLRTAFLTDRRGRNLQAVLRHVDLPMAESDWRSVPPEERQERMAAFLREDRARGFEMGTAPLMRLALFDLEPGRRYFVLSYHHILMDAWSVAIVLRDVVAIYEAACRGEEPVLAPVRPYRDFIDWLRARDLREPEAYWRGELAGFRSPTRVPADRKPQDPAQEEKDPGEVRIALPPERTEALQAFARRSQLTVNTLLQAAWALVLSHHTGRDDVCFGAAMSGRTDDLEGVESVVGLFVGSLPVRVRVRAADGLLSWLKEHQAGLLRMRRYEGTPLASIQAWSEVPGPLFDSLLAFVNHPVDAALRRAEGGLQVRNVRYGTRTNYPLSLMVVPGRELSLRLTYDGGLFEPATASSLLEDFALLLEALPDAGEARLFDLLERVADEERAVIPATAAATGRRAPLSRLFEAQVDRAPDAVAVSAGDARLTYGELDTRANRLARHLAAGGLASGDRAGIYLERSADVVVAILAVLKAGATYLPLDPAYPPERVAFALRDSDARLLVTTGSLAAGLPGDTVRVVRLDAERDEIAGRNGERPELEIPPEQPAYVIYTSGSTGRPKGVMVSHHNVDRLFTATDPMFGFAPQDVWTLFHSSAFDFSVWEIWGALLYGGRLVVASYRESRSPEAFYRLLRDERVTVLNQTPSAFRQLLWAEELVLDGASPDLALRWVVFGGEALEPASVAPWFERHGDLRPRLVNMYGITETTVHVTWWPFGREDAASGRGSLIGRPIPDLSLHALDSGLRPQPVGVPGELYVGGEGVALGYLGRPDLTAERFVPDPFGPPGARLYRSGDLARLLADGALEYLGRIDNQVKIRGFRIELGEIEAALAAHPAVREAVVLAQEDGPGGERRLVAYLVAGLEGTPTAAELRQHLAARLPDYMVPSAFVTLERLPLTVNGKVDQGALRALETAREDGGHAGTPDLPVEEILAGIWAEVLGSGSPARSQGFLALGGHSLLAAQVVSRVRQALAVELPVHELLGDASLADVAARLTGLLETRQGLALPPIQPVPRQGDLPVSFAQNRLWVLDQLGTAGSAYNVPLAVRLLGPLASESLARALCEVVRRHESLRTTFEPRDGEAVQVVHPAAGPGLPLIDLGGLQDDISRPQLRQLMAQDAARPFDLRRGPLLRAALLRLSGEEHLLLVTMHHVVSDRWSIQVLLAELAALYEAFAAGLPSPLPEPVLQYADFAAWQRQQLRGEVLDRLLGYWRAALSGAPAAVEVPGDLPRPPERTYRGASLDFYLPAPLVEALRGLGRQEGATLFMTLFAACNALVHQRSGLEDVVVGTDTANRNRRETEGMIGFFVNQLVLRTDLAGDPGFRELVRRTREAAIGAYLHQELPFDKLLEALHPERAPGRTPLFQVKFVLHNIPQAAQSVRSLAVIPETVPAWQAKFDLLFNLVEAADGVRGALEYSTDLYSDTAAREVLADYEAILRAVTADPNVSLGRLSFQVAEEAERRGAERERRLRQVRENRFNQIRRKVASTF